MIDVDRGGKIAWHGPGQLVAYPVIRLTDSLDVTRYVWLLEEALIQVCADFGVAARPGAGRAAASGCPGDPAQRPARPGAGRGRHPGAQGVTMHGFALNCANDLSWYNRIVPCGVKDAGVTSLSAETGRRITVDEVMPVAEKHLAEALGAELVERPGGGPAPAVSAGSARQVRPGR